MFETFGTGSKKQGRVTPSCLRHLVQLVRNKQSNSLMFETFGTVNKKQGRVIASCSVHLAQLIRNKAE